MKWEGNRQSDNVEDRRGAGGGGFRIGGKGLSFGTIIIALIGSMIFGVNPLTLLGMMDGGTASTQQGPAPAPPASDREAAFVSTVLADTEDTWTPIFAEKGGNYVPPKLVLFSSRTPTACGTGQSASGPFYCPADQKVYIDLDFYKVMQQRFNINGDFAQAYVIAHEVGHHVQHLTGIAGKFEEARRSMTEAQANAVSVRMELQADCFAGIWANHADRARSILEQGDVDEALAAATAIGDDALQRRQQGHVVPDSFTHGTSEQRARWFKRGIESGTVEACDTFNARQL
ncbi:neutral zinc metallopeptidase [Pseudoduganella sp. GCM10020061]|uniref:KPN_02809 family neutral zinc metallopeptidase n=1 Tax=Pseudoduganella sp. GCM10020061 TaxID=3317345 RepID=UPI0036402BF0